MFKELVTRNISIYKLHKQYNFNYAFGTSISIAHLSAVTNVKSYYFVEDDDKIIPLQSILTTPFATKVICPIV